MDEHREKENILLKKLIIDTIRSDNCKRVGEVINKLQSIDDSLTLKDIRDAIKELEVEEKIVLNESRVRNSFLNYITTSYAGLPFWLTIISVALTLITSSVTFLLDQLYIVKSISGGIFMLFVPGYALTQLIFPKKKLSIAELIALSIGLSLILTTLVGLIVNYILSRISLDVSIISLSLLTVSLSIISEYRKFIYRQ